MADVQSISVKGMGVSYTQNQSLFVVGTATGVAAGTGGKSLFDMAKGIAFDRQVPPVAVGVQYSHMGRYWCHHGF